MSDDFGLLVFASRSEWREWLKSHHDSEREARIVIFKSGPRKGQLTLRDAQEEAVGFGWVDAINRRIDDNSYWLRFVPRKPGSAWSLSNIRRVERMMSAGRMTPAGLDSVDEARRNGQWELALQVERTDLIPADLERALRARTGALDAYGRLPHSRKKQILRALLTAESSATLERRIRAVVEEVAG
jgi:uncharacterized protein YdeI (YjbR/CyaY-like superfamily)